MADKVEVGQFFKTANEIEITPKPLVLGTLQTSIPLSVFNRAKMGLARVYVGYKASIPVCMQTLSDHENAVYETSPMDQVFHKKFFEGGKEWNKLRLASRKEKSDLQFRHLEFKDFKEYFKTQTVKVSNPAITHILKSVYDKEKASPRGSDEEEIEDSSDDNTNIPSIFNA